MNTQIADQDLTRCGYSIYVTSGDYNYDPAAPGEIVGGLFRYYVDGTACGWSTVKKITVDHRGLPCIVI